MLSNSTPTFSTAPTSIGSPVAGNFTAALRMMLTFVGASRPGSSASGDLKWISAFCSCAGRLFMRVKPPLSTPSPAMENLGSRSWSKNVNLASSSFRIGPCGISSDPPTRARNG